MLVWGIEGRGSLRINGEGYALRPEMFYFLPWGHGITYLPSRRDPFLVGGIHIIPRHGADAPFEFQVAHRPSDALAGAAHRMDGELPGLEGVVRGQVTPGSGLHHLLGYVVHALGEGTASPGRAHWLAQCLVEELAAAAANPVEAPHILPGPIRKMVAHLRQEGLNRPVPLDELAAVSGLSTSSVIRGFKRYLGATPVQWLNRLRMEEAARLLRTTPLPVGHIGQRVGVEDPYYFSKLFRRFSGMPPGAYRKRHSLT